MGEQAGRGVAYNFWVRVKAEQAARGWTDSELYRRSGVARNTINGLETRKRVESATVNALASALDIPQAEAHQLAGLVPAEPGAGAPSAREAILADPTYTEEQRSTLLQVIDLIEQANRARGEGRAAS